MTQTQFKKEHRLDVCDDCPKSVPCKVHESICELVTICDMCEIHDTCTSLCEQMEAYLVRGNKYNPEIPFSNLGIPRSFDEGRNAPYEAVENFVTLLQLKQQETDATGTKGRGLTRKDIPWRALSLRDSKIVVAHFKHGKTYAEIASRYKLAESTVYEIIQGDFTKGRVGALKTLQEYTRCQQIIHEKGDSIPLDIRLVLGLYYVNYLKIKAIAAVVDKSPQWVSEKLQKGKKILGKDWIFTGATSNSMGDSSIGHKLADTEVDKNE